MAAPKEGREKIKGSLPPYDAYPDSNGFTTRSKGKTMYLK
jgi:hypothetical protein